VVDLRLALLRLAAVISFGLTGPVVFTADGAVEVPDDATGKTGFLAEPKSLFLNFSRLLESSERMRLRVAALFVDEYCDRSFLDVAGVMLVTMAISFWSLIT